ncbi:hypothetical protein HMSSN139_57850 [Paenibacillus sp. HMSSN-139]|nr:hypothetical protein HMSSN139_57850 [Paenibacillus sp. HMSSN-139]
MKLLTVFGWVVGFPGVLMALFLASAAGAAAGLLQLARGRRSRGQTLAFGPFLAIGTLVVYMYGKEIIHWYLQNVIPFLMSRRPAHIGITIDEDGIRYVKYNPKRGTVERAGLLPVDADLNEDGVPDVTGLTDMVKRWVNRRGLAGKKVRLAAPTSQSFIRLLHVPKVSKRQQRRVTELEIEGSIRLPFEDPVIDYHWMESRDRRRRC